MIVRRDEWQFTDPDSALAEADRAERCRQLRQTLLAAASRDVAGDPQWFVLSVRNRSEIALRDRLVAENICAWVPTRKARCVRRRTRKNGRNSVAIFSGYVFVRIVPSARAFVGLTMIRDVEAVLGDGKRPLPIDRRSMNELNGLIDAGAFDDSRALRREQLVGGDRVEIREGSFAYVTAVVMDGYRGTRHVRCMAALFGGKAPISVPLENLRKIG